MKAIVITPENRMWVEEYTAPLYESVGRTVGGWIEVAYSELLPEPYCLIVNEEGLLRKLPLNPMGCALCGSLIVGVAAIMKEGTVDGEPDIIGLDKHDILFLGAMISAISGGKVRWKE